mmetsp:Transcript_27658/g.77331  ORF Transcript_27658/g.77331 Transcript_27658/m.77331 type:complete len:386 (+) Transcript_27658:121-1278(+)|eukprot:CAMPEP_0119127472 /NCGR_PEP_ID=MMETSP1310-20130426/6015_1 /TAXON_ID=464262 /ORGANISM="Genus nov. species nov., Strain RCC2339" /LENGTH=385 /DNA_ID=CAMNT_0007117741 /DNA_START=115 /DNA_END=1269 /DNA_ORIENTATION=-
MSVGKVNPNLVSFFKGADNGTLTRTVVAKINVDTEEIYMAGDGRSSVSLQRDYSQVRTLGDMHQPCYLLVKHPGKNQWRFLTLCSDNENVKVKMLYSSAKETLLQAVGQDHFAVDYHVSHASELTFKNIEQATSSAGDDALSEVEKMQRAQDKAEMKEAQSRANQGRPSGIGGYHSVSMPLDSTANDLLSRFKAGTYSFVHLRVNSKNDGVEGVRGEGNVSLSNASSKIDSNQPGFYLFKDGGSAKFVYVCPGKSPVSKRMVSSTAKPSVLDQMKAAGIKVSKTVEASDPGDVDASLFATRSYGSGGSSGSSPSRSQEPDWLKHRNKMVGGRNKGNTGGLPAYGGTTQASNRHTIHNAHPTAQLMGGGNRGGPKKKIVVPPPGAW